MPNTGGHREHFDTICNPHLHRLDEAIERHGDKLELISEKVFNGFGGTINAVSDKLDIEIARNAEEFRNINNTLSYIIKFGATSTVMIFIALIGVLGSIWVSDRAALKEIQVIQVEQARVRVDAPAPLEDHNDSTRDTINQGR